MGKCNLLILDEDMYYIKNLTNYISSEFNNEFNVISFSEQQYYDDFLKKGKKVNVILSSVDFYERNIQWLQNKTVILLSNNKVSNNNLPHIKKFQSVEKICNEIIEIFEASKDKDEVENNGTKLITFYSPIGGIGTTTIALSTAYNIAMQGEKVLYLSFENIQTIGVLSTSKSQYNFSDLILSLREGSEEFEEILQKGVLHYEGTSLCYFNPIDSILDIEDLNLEGVKDLIDNIINKGGYSSIICDLPSNLNSKFHYFFEKSTSVVSIIGQDSISNYKIDGMLKQLDNIKKIKFIYNMFNEEEERFVPRLVAKNLLPIITTIPYYKEIKGVINLDLLRNKFKNFNEKIIQITEEVK